MKKIRCALFLLLFLAAADAGGVRARDGQAASERDAALARIRTLHARLELAPRDSYLNYAVAVLARRAGIDFVREGIDFPLMPLVMDDPARRVDLFRLAAGAAALHESLQLSELLLPARPAGAEEKIPIADLGAPELAALDFEGRLAEERSAGRASVPDPEARLVPGDRLYLRFRDGTELLAFLEEGTAWMRHALDFYGRGARRPDLLFRPFRDLGLPDPRKQPGLFRALHGPVAVVVGDPFLVEGTDLTVILPPGVPAAFFPEGGGRFRAEAGGRVILSNSARALEAVRAAAAGGEDALADRPDYRLFRALLPFSKEESFFCFASEAFLRRLVGARLRILESRRVRCTSHLRTLLNACLLYMEEHGRPPEGIDPLLAGGYVTERTLACPQEGGYRLGPGMEPACSKHGTLDRLTPLGELDLAAVTGAEASAYRRFTRAYRRFWRRNFDPAALRAFRAGRSWRVEFAALPLAEHSLYRNLAAFAGGRPLDGSVAEVVPEDTVFLLTSKVDPSLFRDLEEHLRGWRVVPEGAEKGRLAAAFGDRVTLGLLDGEMRFAFDLAAFLGEAVRWRLTTDLLAGPLIAGADLPAFAVVPVRDRARAKACLDVIEAGLVKRGRLAREGGVFSLRLEHYGLDAGEEGEGEIEALTFELFSFKFRLFYGLGDNALYFATRPEVLGPLLRGGASRRAAGKPFNLRLTLFPGRWKRLRKDMLLGYEEGARRACMRHLVALEPFAARGVADPARLLGARLCCPDGGRYAPAGEGGLSCSLHGTPARPRQAASPAPPSGTARLLEGLEEVTFSLRFVKDGIRTEIDVRRGE